MLAAGCDGEADDDSAAPTDDDDVTADDDDDSEAGDDDSAPLFRWSGSAQVRVVDRDGAPVEGIFALEGGAPPDRWATTDADGLAEVEVLDDGLTDRWLLAGGHGWVTGGVDLDDQDGPDGVMEISVHPLPLPEDDNPDYHFQPGGTSHSMDTSECGHCHPSIADGWLDSPHHDSAANPRTWDIYVGGTDLDATDCAARGGWIADGQEPGVEGGVIQRCYLGGGVLPFLHDDCGGAGQPACDHPAQAASLDAFGSCGDCHTPAMDAIPGGSIDLARITGVGFDEGITCDVCHKTREVVVGPSPGRDGAIQLQRPSEETSVFSQEFDPITFGPYPDVAIAIMKGSYQPGMRDPGWCSNCHEYARGSLRSDQPVDAQRWPDGLPINETWSEFQASAYAGTAASCQVCHMGVLDEESSTYDISALDLIPSVDQGWLRETGEVRFHHFEYLREAPAMDLSLALARVGTEVHATVSLTNTSAGHALPTGEPMRQLLLRVQAADGDGNPVGALSGQAVPDVGGWLTRGVVGVDVALQGDQLVFGQGAAAEAVAARFVRPSGEWDDYPGPGTGAFTGHAAEDKGLPIHHVVGERAVTAVNGDTVSVDGGLPELETGDIVYLAGDHDAAGAPGWLFAKVLVDGDGNRGVAHYRAVDMASDNRLPPQATATSQHAFPTLAPLEELTVTVTLVKRNYAAPVAHVYGWDVGDDVLEEISETYVLVEQ